MFFANNVFEIQTVDPIKRISGGTTTMSSEVDDGGTMWTSDTDMDDDPSSMKRRLKMKGQMTYMSEWDSIIFLETPM